MASNWDYMADVFEHPFAIGLTEELPEAKDAPQPAGATGRSPP